MPSSLTVISVSGADDETHNLTTMGPVTSTGASSGGVWNTRISGRDDSSRYGGLAPIMPGLCFWCSGPSTTRLRIRARGGKYASLTPSWIGNISQKLVHVPPIVGTGVAGSYVYVAEAAAAAGASDRSADRAHHASAPSRPWR